MFNKLTNKKNRLVLIIFALALVISLEQGWLLFSSGSVPKDLAGFAKDIIRRCSSASYKIGCYDHQIPQLMDPPGNLTMNQAFSVAKLVQKNDREYLNCHLLGHEISAKQTSRNPDRWEDVVMQCPNDTCSSGCIHGAFQERFRTDSMSPGQISKILPQLKDLCSRSGDKNGSSQRVGSCYHGVGHLAMYITGADVKTSLKICDNLLIEKRPIDYHQTCYEGVFMQLFQPLEPDDIALVKGKQPQKQDLLTFCSQFSGMYQTVCWKEGWPLYQTDLNSPNDLVKYCSALKDQNAQDTCLRTLIIVATSKFSTDKQKLEQYCDNMKADKQGVCFDRVMSFLVETSPTLINDAKDICSYARQQHINLSCTQELARFRQG